MLQLITLFMTTRIFPSAHTSLGLIVPLANGTMSCEISERSSQAASENKEVDEVALSTIEQIFSFLVRPCLKQLSEEN